MNTSRWVTALTHRRPLGILCALYLVGVGSLAIHFPPVNTDEVVTAVHGENLLSGQGQRYSLFDGLFAPGVYDLRDAFPDISKLLFNGWVGLWLKVFGRTYGHARWSSVFAGFLSLIAFYEIGSTLRGGRFGLGLAWILALNPIFLFAACLVRPETLLLLTGALILLAILRIRESWRWKPLACGILSGLQISIHQNAVALCLGLWIFYITSEKPARRRRTAAWMAFGIAAGVLLTFATIDMNRFILTQKLFYYELYKPPLFSMPWTPWRWMAELFVSWTRGTTFYIRASLAGSWSRIWPLWWSACAVALGGAIWQKEDRWGKAFAYGGLATVLGMAVLVKRRELIYSVAVFPFLLPLAALFFFKTTKPIHLLTMLRLLAAGLGLASLILFGRLAKRCMENSRPYDDIAAEIRRIVPAHARLAGPNVLWFTWEPDLFRDPGAWMFSRWYTGGQRALDQWTVWKPNFIIIDGTIKGTLIGTEPTDSVLASLLHRPVRRLATVDTGSAAYDQWDVYEVNWQ